MARSITQTFELEQFIKTILSSYKQSAISKGIELHIKDDLASHVLLCGNTKKIKFLLDTVLQNTIRFSGATRVCFSTKQLLKTDTEILVEFLLEDNGKTDKGLRPFTYYRTLVMAKLMIEQLNGKSELIISQNSGTKLRFIIKCTWKEMSAQPRSFSSTSGLKSKKVLIVEDNEINQHTIIHILQKEGVEFCLASNGKEGIDMLEKMAKCDLVIMDIDMPYMDGYDATNYIRKKLQKDVPVIGMTSGEEAGQALKCIEAGMNGFIRKPFTADELIFQATSFFGPEFYNLEPVVLNLKTA